ncbi:MAG: tripartite tricarboxylate transporter substrate-binding protein [Betaproteobacteria bacterium]|nr:tripartite tricarboxylate transporter substrate-binding protein [Betaproteobacteria bacterium]MDH3438897.1 tripartite tricarboxylate transporter substrate-binding protein [Betaproteobacteria bacterium]
MKRSSAGLVLSVAGMAAVLALAPPARGDSVADFYKGKDVTLIVGSGSGGTNALYGRTLAAHLGRHIPGKPNVIAQFMPGGGGIKAANYFYTVAPKDGTVLLHPQSSHPQAQVLGSPGVKFDVTKYFYLGRTASQNSGIFVWHTVAAKTLMDVRTHEVIIGASGRGSETYQDPTIINSVLGTKFKVITGYKGGGEMDLALERGETTGDAGPILSVFVRQQHWLQKNLIRFLVQTGSERHFRLPDVPLLTEFARNDEERAVFAFMSARANIGRTLVAPPGVPAERVAALRKAMADVLKDPAFLAEAEQRKMDVIPASAQEVEAAVKVVFDTPPAVIARVKKALDLK